MTFDRLWYELKLHRVTWMGMPIVIMSIIGLVALLQLLIKGDPARVMLAGLELFLPLSSGLVVGSTLAQEPALELHLTMPRQYYQTGMLRVGLIVGWTACIALLASSAMFAYKLITWPVFLHAWPACLLWLLTQLIWLAPLLWFVGIGLCLALLTKSRTACAAILGIIWLVDFTSTGFFVEQPWLRPLLLFPTLTFSAELSSLSQNNFTAYWFTTKCTVIGMALLFFPLGWLLLHSTERLLQSATEE